MGCLDPPSGPHHQEQRYVFLRPICFGCSVARYSFIHLFQYLVMRSCTNRQRFLGFKAILSRTLGASCPPIWLKRKWFGIKTCSSSGSLLQYVTENSSMMGSTGGWVELPLNSIISGLFFDSSLIQTRDKLT